MRRTNCTSHPQVDFLPRKIAAYYLNFSVNCRHLDSAPTIMATALARSVLCVCSNDTNILIAVHFSLLPAPKFAESTIDEPALVTRGQQLSLVPKSTIPPYGQCVICVLELEPDCDVHTFRVTGVKVGVPRMMQTLVMVARIPRCVLCVRDQAAALTIAPHQCHVAQYPQQIGKKLVSS